MEHFGALDYQTLPHKGVEQMFIGVGLNEYSNW